MNHREHVMPEMVRFFEGKDIGSVLELGARDNYDFKDKFNIPEWKCTDKEDGTLMEKLPFEDNSFDLIFSCHAFEHCEDPISALREMKRVSRKWVVILTPNHCYHQILDGDDDHIFVLTKMQMKKLFRYTGIREYEIYVQEMNMNEQFWNLISIGETDE